jgi:predicted phosphodiesterase
MGMIQVFKYIGNGFRRMLAWLLTKPVTSLANRFSSAPREDAVFKSLSELYQTIQLSTEKKEPALLHIDPSKESWIILSDHHKGKRNGADDFTSNEDCYLAALEYYNTQSYSYINLGDSEELWENNIFSILKHNLDTFAAERKFIERNAYYKIYGNHDSFWRFDPLSAQYLKQMYGQSVSIFGGLILNIQVDATKNLQLLCTHGHQGDATSDGNWLSAAFVTYIWGPLQSFLRINTNTPSSKDMLKTLHNSIMYKWSAAQQHLVLITGHTHQPVFASLTHLERLLLNLETAVQQGDIDTARKIEKEIPRRRREYGHINNEFRHMKPTYFNTGCCCYSDGNITGIEIAENKIRLVKWEMDDNVSKRIVAEEMSIAELIGKL